MAKKGSNIRGVWIVMAIATAVVAGVALVIWANKQRLEKAAVLRTLERGITVGRLRIVDENTGRVMFEVNRTAEPAGTVWVRDERAFFEAVAWRGDAGLGDAYTRGVWRADDLFAFLLVMTTNMNGLVGEGGTGGLNRSWKADEAKDGEVVQHHYDVGNDFYRAFLTDRLMAYSCGFWLCPSDTLESAQLNKVNFVIRKLGATTGHRVLDIGCGWGRVAAHVAKQTGATVHGITISKEQIRYIETEVPEVRAFYGHYVPRGGTYDRIYSIGMFEHVRCKNYGAFFDAVTGVLEHGGRFVLHTITTHYDSTRCETGSTKNFLTEYIFPGGQIPKVEWVLNAARRAGLKIVHVETLGGQHYAKTLRAWRRNMLEARDKLLTAGYADATLKAYEYYFAECEAAFFSDHMQLSHFVFDKIQDTTRLERDVFECAAGK